MSTSGPRLSRLMTMVPWLLAHDGVSIEEAAQHFGISAEQCEKDLWLLVVCGLPGHMPDQLVDIQFWDDGRIHVIDPQTLDRPLELSGDEVMSMLVALRLLAQVPGSHDRVTLYGLIERLENHLEVKAAQTVLIDSGTNAASLLTVEEALQQHRKLELVYASGTHDDVSERTVSPIRVIVTDGHSYLEAFCEKAEAVRTFRLDRIMSLRLSGPQDLKPIDAESEVLHPQSAVVQIDASARWILDMYPIQSVIENDDGNFVGNLAYRELDWLIKVALSLRGALEVCSPSEARHGVATAAAAALAAYS